MNASEMLDVLLIGTRRSIQGIIPDVTITEQIVDEVQVTTHPVEYGSDIADHAFVKPSVIRCQFGWSDSSRMINGALQNANSAIKSLISGTGSAKDSLFKAIETTADVYKRLQELMVARQPFELKTGKRNFGNVIITRLELNTNGETENALVVDITFQQILFVTTKTFHVDKAYLETPKNSGAKSVLPKG